MEILGSMKEYAYTHSHRKPIGFEYPAVYSIRVIGNLDRSWSTRLCGLNLLSHNTELTDGIVVTTMIGELIDQASLLGVLNTLYNLRLTIWSVEFLGIPKSQTGEDLPQEDYNLAPEG